MGVHQTPNSMTEEVLSPNGPSSDDSPPTPLVVVLPRGSDEQSEGAGSEAAGSAREKETTPKPHVSVRVGIIGLLCQFVLWSIGGPAFKSVHTEPLTRCSWRLQVSLLVMFPFAVRDWRKLTRAARAKLLTRRQLLALGAVSVAMLGNFVCWNLSISGSLSTAFAHLAILSQVAPLVLVAATTAAAAASRIAPRRIKLRPWPTFVELLGCTAGAAGVVISVVLDGERSGAEGTHGRARLSGDLLSLTLGVINAVYITLVGTFLPTWPPFMLQWGATAGMLLQAALFFPLAGVPWHDGEGNGMLDWPVSPELFPYVLIMGSATAIGHAALTLAAQALPSLVVGLAIATIPLGQELCAWGVFRNSDPPRLWMWVGTAFVLFGIIINVLWGRRGPTASPVDTISSEEEAGEEELQRLPTPAGSVRSRSPSPRRSPRCSMSGAAYTPSYSPLPTPGC
eukprot:TRINITY_DN1079_c0_g1_i1.p1 TRINITY_DN1079_c0_g1~~TRINITY_DN1079_c0_g1_i1.p1  ORF type:complete len:453 (+),score=66.74 TRINITY_DN1079_c0_g1_i1:74-1432(+)